MTAARRPDNPARRYLPRPLVIPDVMTLKTLADVRKLIDHLLADRTARSTWHYVVTQLEAAVAGSIEPIEASLRCAWC